MSLWKVYIIDELYSSDDVWIEEVVAEIPLKQRKIGKNERKEIEKTFLRIQEYTHGNPWVTNPRKSPPPLGVRVDDSGRR